MHVNKICPVCHQFFEARRKNQIYCSFYCRKKHHKEIYYKEIYYNENRIISTIEDNNKIVLRKFRCKKCNKLVIVMNKEDRRKVFCSPRCEKLYWKHPKKNK